MWLADYSLFRFVGIFQRGSPVEYRMLWRAVRILEIISDTLELYGDSGLVFQQCRLGITFRMNQRIRIQEILVILVLRNLAHICQSEELVIETEVDFLRVFN